jgi:hypothetical protein
LRATGAVANALLIEEKTTEPTCAGVVSAATRHFLLDRHDDASENCRVFDVIMRAKA